jgi:general stress protein 26
MSAHTLRENIQEVIVGPHLHSVATVTEAGLPWVRYIMAVGYDDLTIQFATNLKSRKIAQLKANPEVHTTCGVGDLMEIKPYVQIEGRAEIQTDQAVKTAFWVPPFEQYFGSDTNPDYCVVKIVPYHMEYLAVGSKRPEVLELL